MTSRDSTSRGRAHHRGGAASSNGSGGRRGMDANVRASKALSLILRHKASDMGLVMRPDGYVQLDHLLALPRMKPLGLSYDDIKSLVDSSDKQRFQLSTEGGVVWIRAAQGHTVAVVETDQLLTPVTDASQAGAAIHGSYMNVWPLIRASGLSRMARRHVHLATSPAGSAETISGMRRDCDLLIHVDVARAMAAGIKFWLSSNRVLLTEGDAHGFIPAQYFARAERLAGGRAVEVLSLVAPSSAGASSPATATAAAVAVAVAVADAPVKRRPPGFEQKATTITSAPAAATATTPSVAASVPSTATSSTSSSASSSKRKSGVAAPVVASKKAAHTTSAKKDKSRSAAVINDDDDNDTPNDSVAVASPSPSTPAKVASPAKQSQSSPAVAPSAVAAVVATPSVPFLPLGLPSSFTDKKWPSFFDKETAVTSAVAIVLPKEFWPQCQAIRSQHDKSYRRWPPHINLLYPFINAKNFAPYQLMEKLKAAVTDVPSFTVRLSRLDMFVHPKSCTLILEPEATPSTALVELQKRIETAFPHCATQSERGDDGYHAHCSLGQAANKGAARRLIDDHSHTWQTIEFTVDQLIVLTRTPKWSGDTSEDGPEHSFHTAYTVPLGNMTPLVAHQPPVPYVATAPPRVAKAALTAVATGEEKVAKIAPIKTRRGDDASPSWITFPTYRCDKSTNLWTATVNDEKKPLTNINAATLTAVTYNVLFDKFEQHLIHTAQRLPVLFDILEQTKADIIGLEEVTPSFVRQLLSLSWVRDHYYVSDTDTTTGGITVNPDGQLLLSRHPFITRIHAYSKQKRVIVGEFRLNHRRVLVPVVHLTSDHQDGAMQKRIKQMEILYDHVLPLTPSGIPNESARDCIMLGDFNFGDGEDGEEHALRNDFKDVWRVIHGSDNDGYTFDPATNPLAKVNTQSGVSRRLDRVMIASDTWRATSVQRIGTTPWDIVVDKKKVTLMASDHYGLRCELAFTLASTTSDADSKSDASGSSTMAAAAMLLPDTDFDKLLADIGGVETKAGDIARAAAIAKLESCLPPIFVDKSPVGDIKPEMKDGSTLFKVYVIGSVAMGIHSPSSDIDAICVGGQDRADFFKYAQRVIASTPITGVKLKQVLVDDVLVPVVKVVVDGIHIDLQYCRLPNRTTFDRWFDLATVPDKDLRKLDVQSTITLNGYRDAQLLTGILGATGSALRKKWITLFHIVKHWAKRRGLYSNRLGYLGGYGWSLLAARVCQLYPKAPVRELVCRFFDTYANWSWSLQPVSLADPMTGRVLPYTLTPRDVCAVVTLTAPYRNSARNVTPSTRNILIEEFTRATRVRTWNELFEPSDFFTRHRAYLMLQVGAVTARDFISWTGWIESRVVSLLTKIEKQAPRLTCQPWSEQMICAASGFPIACTYYIGLSVIGDTNTTTTTTTTTTSTAPAKSPTAAATAAKKAEPGVDFGSAVIDFQQSVGEWKGKTSYMDLTVKQVKRDRITSQPLLFVMPDDETDELDTNETSSTTTTTTVASSSTAADSPAVAPSAAAAGVSSKEGKKTGGERGKSPSTRGAAGKKESGKKGTTTSADAAAASKVTIQTSEAVYNRIRWDPSLNASEWCIGYEDRFKGMMEMAFNDFRTNDDEWIPWHRVWYFKQKGTIMWDREQRIDLLGAKK